MSKKGIPFKIIFIVMVTLLVVIPITIFGIIELKVSADRASIDVQNVISNDISVTYKNVQNVFESVQAKVKSDLILAEYILNSDGSVYLDNNQKIELDAVNQISKEKTTVTIPVMMAGDTVLSTSYTLVDEIQKYAGGTATVFQIIPQGLLRVSTNVLKEDFTRAVGTYIPTDSIVYKTVMKGDTFYGRAFVVNSWYITAYKPILGADGSIIGVMYVGVKEDPFKQKVFSN